jgi:hypothetical protein
MEEVMQPLFEKDQLLPTASHCLPLPPSASLSCPANNNNLDFFINHLTSITLATALLTDV